MEDSSGKTEVLQPKDKDTIIAEYQAVTKAWDKLAEEVNPVLQSLTPDDEQEVKKFYSDETTQLLIDQAEIGKIANLKIRRAVEIYGIEVPALQQRAAIAEAAYKPILKEDIIGIVSEVTPRVNYFSVFNSPPNDQEQTKLWYLKERLDGFMLLRAAEKSIQTGKIDEYSFDKLIMIYNILQKSTDEWKSKSWLDDEPDPDRIGDASEEDIKKLEETVDWYAKQASTYRSLAKFYQPNRIIDDSFSPVLEAAFYITRGLRNYSLPWTVFTSVVDDKFVDDFEIGTDNRLVSDLDYFIHDKMADEDTGVAPRISQTVKYQHTRTGEFFRKELDFDSEAVWNGIKIEGLEAKPDERLVISQEEIIEELKKRVPSSFVKNLNSIKFTQYTGDTSGLVGEGSDEEITITGQHFSRNDPQTGKYTHDDIEVYREYSVPREEADLVVTVKRALIVDTIVHEIAHGVHDKLTLEEMLAWEKVLAEDQTALTHYVHLARNAVEHKDVKGRIEDFAESMMYFANHTPAIYFNSRARHDYMANLIGAYVKPNERDRINQQIKEQWVQYNSLQGLLAQIEQQKQERTQDEV